LQLAVIAWLMELSASLAGLLRTTTLVVLSLTILLKCSKMIQWFQLSLKPSFEGEACLPFTPTGRVSTVPADMLIFKR
jgi:hypothetical protein